MIICPECGGENPQESKYCINCGIKLTDNELENETEKVQEDKRVIVNNYIYNTNEQKNENDGGWCCGGCVAIFLIVVIVSLIWAYWYYAIPIFIAIVIVVLIWYYWE